MTRKLNMKFSLLCIVMLSLALTVSCAKKPPETTIESEQAEAAETRATESETDTARADEDSLTEEELEARRQAEAEARQETADARDRFVSQKVYFKFDDSSLTDSARDVLRDKVQWLRNHPDACVIIEGHCDERGTDEYNLALGSRRAESVKDFLTKAGINGSRLTTISYGEERPAVKGHNEEAWAENRRAEFRFCSSE
ncbi:MAG: peptidoglycan-associated lipoprotein Pal [Desulfobacterales bacterium]|nr:peptidoglycan-associated lipoprotein Pal [Desulfobacterales bacterium]MBS3756626.1 peptidoglycan-associated lipoprotein Pal [Desulfobacterales bacterium]